MSDCIVEILSVPLDEKDRGEVAGKIGELKIVPISSLRVDMSYQRAMSLNSVRNIRKICGEFSWAKFLPVIVVEVDGGKYSVIDGQHRTTAAATLGIEEVPCYVLKCSVQDAAAAFAAINGNVTAMNPVDLWFAKLAARDPDAMELSAVLEAAEVTITRKKDGYYPGETRSVGVLQRAIKFYGSPLLITILQCITQTGNGNPGMLFGAPIHGIGRSIRTKPDLISNPMVLFEAIDDWAIADRHHEANIEYAKTQNPVQAILTRMLNEHLRSKGVSR